MFASTDSLTLTDDLPFTISPSTSCLRLSANEIGKSLVELTGWFQEENRHATIRVEFDRCVGARLLAYGGGEAGLGIGMVDDSKWLAEANHSQRKYQPNHPENFAKMNHYFFRGHDCSVEVLAEGFSWKDIGV